MFLTRGSRSSFSSAGPLELSAWGNGGWGRKKLVVVSNEFVQMDLTDSAGYQRAN